MRLSFRTAALVCVLALGAPTGAAGRETQITGTLVETHGHRLDGTIVQRSFAIRSARRARRLSDAQPRSLIGQRVRIDGEGGASSVPGTVRPDGVQRLAAAVPPGPRSLLVIVLTTPDKPRPAATPAEVRSAVFTGARSTNVLFQQQSAGATRFVGRVRGDGDVTEPLAIGVTTPGCDFAAFADAGDSAARAAGWAADAYDHVMYLLPNTSHCSFGGLGDMPGRRTWSNGYLDVRIVAHELGHNLGADHAGSQSCSDAGGIAVTLSTTCVSDEYGDPFDVMGIPDRLMSSWHRAQLGQLPASQELRLRESQTVTLVSADDFTAPGNRLLLVPRKEPRVVVTSWLAAELRSELGPFDLWGIGSPVTRGLSVRVVPNVAVTKPSLLLDARPDTSSFEDAPIQVGETLRDEPHGIAIRLNSVTGTSADVTVTMPVLVDDVPPSAPGNVSVNGDSSGVAIGWTAAIDDEAIAHYEVERDAVIIGTTPGLDFTDDRVTEVTQATYRVIAVDTSGNRAASEPATIVVADVTPPTAVPGVSLSADGPQVTASWAAAQDNRAVARYQVYRNGEPRATTTGLSHTERPPAGRHVYAVSAVDTAGNAGPRTEAAFTVAVTAPDPAGNGPPPAAQILPVRSAPDTARPRLTELRVSPRRFRARPAGGRPSGSGRGGRRGAPVGTTIRLKLSEAAVVTLRFERSGVGRRIGKNCRQVTKANRANRRCTRYEVAGRLQPQLLSGGSNVAFTGRIGRGKLPPGTYRVTAVPTDAAGNTGARRTATFTVVAG